MPNDEKMLNDEKISSDEKLSNDGEISNDEKVLNDEKMFNDENVSSDVKILEFKEEEIAYLKQKKERYLTIYNNFINAGKRWEATIKEDQQYYNQITEYMRVINQPRLFNPSQTVSPAGEKQATPEAQTVVKNKVMQAVRQVRERE